MGVKAIVSQFVVVACMAGINGESAKGDTPAKLKAEKPKRNTLTTFVGCVL